MGEFVNAVGKSPITNNISADSKGRKSMKSIKPRLGEGLGDLKDKFRGKIFPQFIIKKNKKLDEKHFIEKEELKIILDLYAKMVSQGSWKDYGLSISSKQVSFSVFKNSTENALYRICKNFNPKNKNLKYLITDVNGKILKNSFELEVLLKKTDWKKLT